MHFDNPLNTARSFETIRELIYDNYMIIWETWVWIYEIHDYSDRRKIAERYFACRR